MTRYYGTKLADSNFEYLNSGSYGVVFADKSRCLARKVFLAGPDEGHIRKVFKSEIEAYRMAASDNQLALLIPGHFKVCCLAQVILDKAGNNISSEFIPSLAYEMEYVDGDFQKFNHIDDKEIQRIKLLFNQVGIYYTKDMSVHLGDDGRVVKAVDFGIEEHIPEA